MATTYLISEELADAILSYLAQRPYAEVYRLVAQLQSLPETEIDEPPQGDEVPPATS